MVSAHSLTFPCAYRIALVMLLLPELCLRRPSVTSQNGRQGQSRADRHFYPDRTMLLRPRSILIISPPLHKRAHGHPAANTGIPADMTCLGTKMKQQGYDNAPPVCKQIRECEHAFYFTDSLLSSDQIETLAANCNAVCMRLVWCAALFFVLQSAISCSSLSEC